MVLHRGQLHQISLPTATEMAPDLCLVRARLQPQETGINPTSTDHKRRPPKADMVELGAEEEDLVVDLVLADLAMANGSMASTFQAHQTHA